MCYMNVSQIDNDPPHDVEAVIKTSFETGAAGVPVCAFGSKRYVGHIVGLLYSLTHIKAFNLKAIPTDVAKDRLLCLKQIFQEILENKSVDVPQTA